MKPLKELMGNKRQLQREMRKPRQVYSCAPKTNIFFCVDGDTLKVVGAR